jgi:REP element-mobilizing transposase RayT
MPTHQQLLYHIVFSTKERRQLLKDDSFRESVWSYMAGIVTNLEGHALRIGGYFDHAHLLLRIPAKIAVSDFVRQLKANTSKHINQEHTGVMKFQWQDGYGVFTVSPSNRAAVFSYIDRQLDHHRQQTFQEEYLNMLANHEVEYDSKYLWE